MAVTIIYPSDSYWHVKDDRNWSVARDAASSTSVFPTPPSSVGIVLSRNYYFYRIYMSFDLSSVPPGSTIDTISLSLKRVDGVKSSYVPYIAYAGNSIVNRDISEYSLYLTHSIGGTELSTIAINDTTRYFTSNFFDTLTYPVSPGDVLSIGVIDTLDFDKTINGTSSQFQIDTDPAGDLPYIEVTYSTGGYSNPVMGINNFSSLNGVATASIVNVMGVQ